MRGSIFQVLFAVSLQELDLDRNDSLFFLIACPPLCLCERSCDQPDVMCTKIDCPILSRCTCPTGYIYKPLGYCERILNCSTTTTTSPTTHPTTTQCSGVCICEKSCATVKHNPMGCDSFRCIKDCHCPRGYKRDNAARVCVPILECTTTQTPTTTTQSTTPGTSTFLPQFFLKLSFKKVTFSHS